MHFPVIENSCCAYYFTAAEYKRYDECRIKSAVYCFKRAAAVHIFEKIGTAVFNIYIFPVFKGINKTAAVVVYSISYDFFKSGISL